MLAEGIGKILNTYFQYILITDIDDKILWIDKKNQELFDKNIAGCNLEDIFKIKTGEVSSNNYIEIKLGKEEFRMKINEINIEETVYKVALLERLDNSLSVEDKLYCLEEIINKVSEGIMLSDKDHRIALYNPAQEELEKLSSKDVIGKRMWEAFDYDNSDNSEHKRVFETGKPIINKYRAHSFKNDIPQYTSYSTFPIKRNEETLGVFSIGKNETILRNLLYETIELKRKLYDRPIKTDNIDRNNGTNYSFSDMVGSSDSMKNLIKEAQSVATLDSSILIVGETGTGKEVLAQSTHNFGREKERFVAVNCAAIPENLLESILFGTVKGSYTGAVDRMGLFEEAGNGTLFLDEINSMSVSMQAKLLRVLQEKKVRRVGSVYTKAINCRIICATNEEPQKLIKEGKLRVDLFYRIAGFCLYIPSLRDRKDDIMSMADFFVKKYNKLLNKNVKVFSTKLAELILSYKWPGNVRELEHVMHNLMIKVDDNKKELTYYEIPRYLKELMFNVDNSNVVEINEKSLPDTLREIEKKMILDSLFKNKWNLTWTSKDLGIIRQSLKYRMRKLDIERPKDLE